MEVVPESPNKLNIETLNNIRREKNRMSAKKSRIRKKERQTQLLKELHEAKKVAENLLRINAQLRKTIASLVDESVFKQRGCVVHAKDVYTEIVDYFDTSTVACDNSSSVFLNEQHFTTW